MDTDFGDRASALARRSHAGAFSPLLTGLAAAVKGGHSSHASGAGLLFFFQIIANRVVAGLAIKRVADTHLSLLPQREVASIQRGNGAMAEYLRRVMKGWARSLVLAIVAVVVMILVTKGKLFVPLGFTAF